MSNSFWQLDKTNSSCITLWSKSYWIFFFRLFRADKRFAFPSKYFIFIKKIVFGNLQKFDKSKSENLIWLPTLNLTNKFVLNHIASKSNEIPIVFTNKRLQNFLSKYIFQTHEKWFLSIFKNLTRVSQRIWLTLTLNLTNTS